MGFFSEPSGQSGGHGAELAQKLFHPKLKLRMNIFGPIKKLSLAFGYFVAAVAAVFIFWRSGQAFGMISLLVVVSFAIVGKGNRKLWLFLFPIVFSLLLGAPYLILDHASKAAGGNVFIALLGFALMPVLPGLFLGAAHTIRLRRLRDRNSPLHTDVQSRSLL